MRALKSGGRRAIIIHLELKRSRDRRRRADDKLEEALRLAEAIHLEITDSRILNIAAPRPATLLGQGQMETMGQRIRAQGIELAIVNHALSPVQQRNLEKAWNCKVIDRTALILEIFGARARTSEGKLQVELASLTYQRSRLVRSWTHLERQRGGFGFLGGPGESQLEVDRRLIRDRIAKIRKELETVTRTRGLHRKQRVSVPYPLVALIGYTNAGKSTLFNRLTGAQVAAMDALFATLDPTMRGVKLPSGFTMILSDTVGFISELPTDLIAAFRATLEEVRAADLILHVRDIAHPDTAAQKQDVDQVLASLFDAPGQMPPLLEVHNKIDLLPGLAYEEGISGAPISALTGKGITSLLKTIDDRLSQNFYCTKHIELSPADHATLAWLHRHGRVLESRTINGRLCLTVKLCKQDAGNLPASLQVIPQNG